MATQRFFHLHLISDATGETLIAVARAAAAQYKQTHAIEHIHSNVRTQAVVERALREIEQTPGIVLYTLVDAKLAPLLEAGCRNLGVPCLSVLDQTLKDWPHLALDPVAAQHAFHRKVVEICVLLHFRERLVLLVG